MAATSRYLQNLKLSEKSAVSLKKTEPNYILCIADSLAVKTDDPIIAAASSNYEVRLFSGKTLASLGSITGHNDVVSDVTFAKQNTNLLFTSSWDNSVKCWDFRTNTDKAVNTYTGDLGPMGTFSCCDINCDDNYLCVGTNAIDRTNDTSLLLWDVRKTSEVAITFEESHSDDITRVKFHKDQPNDFVSGSTDGLVCFFDISEQTEDDALMFTFNSESSVSNVGWYKPNSKQVYCITHINTFHVWDCANGDDVIKLKNSSDSESDSKWMNDYLVDFFYHKASDSMLLVGGTYDGNAIIYDVNNDGSLTELTVLEGGHSDVVRGSLWNDENGSLVTAGEDSLLCLWKDASQLLSSSDSKSNHKVKSKKKSGKARTLPY